MSNFPDNYDDDTTLPPVNDNIQDIGAEAINALRDAVFNIEQYLGIGGEGTTSSISSRIGVSLDADGKVKSSAIASLGLVTLPITNDQISNTAEIPESKLKLDHRTQDLFNYIQDLSNNVNTSLGWISLTGIKLEPHLLGAIYRHTLNQIDVSSNANEFLKNKFNELRNNQDGYTLISDINNEFLTHQFVDGSPISNIRSIVTFNGSSYPSNYAHTASSIYINTDRFSTIPQTAEDLQQFVDFIDSSSMFLYGTRIQNLYTNGISRASRSANLNSDGYGVSIIPATAAITYLLNTNNTTNPLDDIYYGDDIIELKPSSSDMSSNSFDEKFALVKIGDIIRVNYGSIEVQFVIKEKKYIQNSGNKKYIVRINGKNLFYTANALVRIDSPLFNNNKYGVLSVAAANNDFSEIPSLIVGNPRGAQVLGVGFNPDQLDSEHYLLYLVLYSAGSPTDGYTTILPGIDVTGNEGTTPGLYTLRSVVETINNSFRRPGYNYRFIAFSYQGELGIMLADSYNNAAFSIISALVDSNGMFDQVNTEITYPNNVVGIFATSGSSAVDPLGFGPNNSNFASPPFMSTYGSAEAALIPTKIFVPLKRNNYYVNGIEKEKLSLEIFQSLDAYGDGYWTATVKSKNIFPGPAGRVETTYTIPLNLSSSGLKIGMTLVIQSLGQGSLIDYGRFIIQSIIFNSSCAIPSTDITVYDAVHANASSPATTLNVGSVVGLYFNSDSVSFNKENSADFSAISPFKRYFEVFIDQNGKTFTHERGRINNTSSNMTVNGSISLYGSSELNKLNIVKISPKLRGYQFDSISKITLNILEYVNTTGIYSGYLSSYNGTIFTHKGPLTFGKKGQVTRFYDETNNDYIDIIFDINQNISSFSNNFIDFQLFPSLSLDEEIMLIATCQLNDTTKIVNYINDERQFGNTSEKDLSTSVLNLLSIPEKLLHTNGVVRGFDLVESISSSNNNQISLTGGVVLVDGKIIQMNNDTINIPIIKEYLVSLFDINWIICVNSIGEYRTIPMLDYDSILETPTDTTRLFNAFNPIDDSTYFIDAFTFSDLIREKSLVPLYIVSSTVNSDVNPATISLSLTDVRKYVNDNESNFSLVLSSDNIHGNFKSFTSVINWINKNSLFNAHVLLRGTIEVNSQIVFDFSSLSKQIIFEGDGATVNVNIDKGIVMGSYTKFKNINFVFKVEPLSISSANFINNGHGLIYSEIDNKQYLRDVSIEDCDFSIDNSSGNKYSYININIVDSDCYIKNVSIYNNKFHIQNELDYNAAIAVVNTSPLLEGTPYVPTLTNIIIENNICDGDQIIVLTTQLNPTTIKNPGLLCINTRIHHNVCGVIGAITTSRANNSSVDINNMLTISNNSCRYITNLDEKGKFIEFYDSVLEESFVDTNTGNVCIKENNCSFIHYGIQTYLDSPDSLKILNNVLVSNIEELVSHGEDYLSNFGYPSSNKRYAIYVSADLTLDRGSYSNILIDGNRVSTAETVYESYLNTFASGTITNNYFSGIIDAASLSDHEYSAIIYNGKNPGIISNNHIYRNRSSIYAYITTSYDVSTSSIPVQVVNNVFDDSTVDDSSEILGKDASGNNIANYWIFEKNTNQIENIDVRGAVGLHSTNVALSPPFDQSVIVGVIPDDFTVSVIGLTSQQLSIVYTASASAVRRYRWHVDLRDILPYNVSIINVSTNVICTVTASVAGSKALAKLYYNNSAVTLSGTSQVVFDGAYVPNSIIPISITPTTTMRNNSAGNAYFTILVEIGHSAPAIVYLDDVTIKYKW